MADSKRAPSMDMTTFEPQLSPAPTYRSSCSPTDWPLTPEGPSSSAAKESTSSNPYHPPGLSDQPPLSRTKGCRKEDGCSSTKPDYQDPSHPHYVESEMKSYRQSSSPRPSRRHWPQKRVMVPWVLAILFFLTTLWFTAIALGARYLSFLRSAEVAPVLHEINVYVNGDIAQNTLAAETLTITQSPSATLSATPTTTDQTSYTGRLHLVSTLR